MYHDQAIKDNRRNRLQAIENITINADWKEEIIGLHSLWNILSQIMNWRPQVITQESADCGSDSVLRKRKCNMNALVLDLTQDDNSEYLRGLTPKILQHMHIAELHDIRRQFLQELQKYSYTPRECVCYRPHDDDEKQLQRRIYRLKRILIDLCNNK